MDPEAHLNHLDQSVSRASMRLSAGKLAMRTPALPHSLVARLATSILSIEFFVEIGNSRKIDEECAIFDALQVEVSQYRQRNSSRTS